jgi:S-DNA-T family DNA segregation ATPase FtsK/SpoIIIE
MKNLLNCDSWQSKKHAIPLVLGRDISGKEIILDLAEAPHLLIAGATGSGKSVCLNSMLVSLLYRFTPEDMRLILVDPKIVEFSVYKKLPHLIVPVVTETKKVVASLRWIIKEMEERYRVLSLVGARNLHTFNNRQLPEEEQFDDQGNKIPDKYPFIVVVIDELADIMMTARADVETSLARIAQLSRAVGIHTIIATQRPSVDVLTGVIKANFPTRIAFQVSSQFDSRTILDGKGAESLLGRGDMLFKAPRSVLLQRIQSPLVLDDDLEKILTHVCAQADQKFDMDVFNTVIKEEQEALQNQDFSDKDEALIQQAIEIIIRDRKASTSYIQRCLRIGYNRAANIIEILEDRGIVGPQVGSSRREILVDQYDFE